MLFAPERDSRPQIFGNLHPYAFYLGIVGKKVIDQLLREILDLFAQFRTSKTFVGRDQVREAIFLK